MVKKRNTKQKEIIINFLKENKDRHLTAEDILLELRKQSEEISQATIYRNLSELVKEGELRKYISDVAKKACFQYVDNVNKCSKHYHLICDECGSIIHFEGTELQKLKDKILGQNKFEVNLEKVVLYGKCDKCKENKK